MFFPLSLSQLVHTQLFFTFTIYSLLFFFFTRSINNFSLRKKIKGKRRACLLSLSLSLRLITEVKSRVLVLAIQRRHYTRRECTQVSYSWKLARATKGNLLSRLCAPIVPRKINSIAKFFSLVTYSVSSLAPSFCHTVQIKSNIEILLNSAKAPTARGKDGCAILPTYKHIYRQREREAFPGELYPSVALNYEWEEPVHTGFCAQR